MITSALPARKFPGAVKSSSSIESIRSNAKAGLGFPWLIHEVEKVHLNTSVEKILYLFWGSFRQKSGLEKESLFNNPESTEAFTSWCGNLSCFFVMQRKTEPPVGFASPFFKRVQRKAIQIAMPCRVRLFSAFETSFFR